MENYMKPVRKIRWLIAHEPVDLFLRTANAFAEKLAELTDNAFEVEIFTPAEYKTKFEDIYKQNLSTYISGMNRFEYVDPFVLMEKGLLELSQVHITELAKWFRQDFYALELPFLFRDHDHAARVLEGPIGKELLSSLKDKGPVEGLAFTYSGGFRCIVSENELTGLTDLKDVNVATSYNPVAIDTVEALGATPVPFVIRDYLNAIAQEVEGEESLALETTIPRYLAQLQNSAKKHMLNTKHSLFLTSIIASNAFWSELDADTKEKFNKAVLYASRLERNWSVEEAQEFALGNIVGVTYSELSADEIEKFKKRVEPLYVKYKEFFYTGLVDGIIQS